MLSKASCTLVGLSLLKATGFVLRPSLPPPLAPPARHAQVKATTSMEAELNSRRWRDSGVRRRRERRPELSRLAVRGASPPPEVMFNQPAHVGCWLLAGRRTGCSQDHESFLCVISMAVVPMWHALLCDRASCGSITQLIIEPRRSFSSFTEGHKALGLRV